MQQEYSYTEAFAELQEIVKEIERGDISIDELSLKVKRAATLIAICKAKLTATEADVSAILDTLKPQGPEEEETTGDGRIEPDEEDTGIDDISATENVIQEEE